MNACAMISDCHLADCTGCQYEPRAESTLKAGHCPSCHHPQHVGSICGADVGAGSSVTCSCTPAQAIKQTAGKVKGFALFPWEVMAELLSIYQYGISKGYIKDSWRNVDPAEYEDALMRHALARLRGETNDPESKKRHIAHLAWNAITLMVLTAKDELK